MLAGALMPLLCAAQAPQSIPVASLRSGALASPVLLQAAFASAVEGYLATVAPSSRRTYYVRPASTASLDAALNLGVPALGVAGLPDAFPFSLDGEQFLVFQRLRYEKRERTLDVWMGNATLYRAGETMKRAGGSGPAVLIAKNGLIRSGSAYVGGGGPFVIVGLSESLIAVREADAGQFRLEAKAIRLGGAKRAHKVPKSAAGTLALRIAIHFTRAAENELLMLPGNGQNIHSVIASEVAALRRSFYDAGIGAEVKILPSNDGARTDYAEKDSIEGDVVCLAKAEPECRSMLQHAVHATILVRNKSGGCGMAGHEGGDWKDPSLAVAVVGWNCISNLQHGLVHELGHVLGGQHEHGGAPGALAFAKAYVTPDGKFGTLLSEMRPGMLRLPYWSTTKIYPWLGHPVGDVKHNNALAFSQTIPQIIKSLEQ
ncbi:MAG: hypothetical protein ACT4P3_08140 [Betaproteobacteria bacterium]